MFHIWNRNKLWLCSQIKQPWSNVTTTNANGDCGEFPLPLWHGSSSRVKQPTKWLYTYCILVPWLRKSKCAIEYQMLSRHGRPCCIDCKWPNFNLPKCVTIILIAKFFTYTVIGNFGSWKNVVQNHLLQEGDSAKHAH